MDLQKQYHIYFLENVVHYLCILCWIGKSELQTEMIS